MMSHSFIVCATLIFSLVAQVGATSIDDQSLGVSPADTAAILDAVLHKEVGLQQDEDNGRGILAAQVIADDCEAAVDCANTPVVEPPEAQTRDEWFAVRKRASEANPLIAILLILASTFFYLCRSISTK